MQAGVFWAVLGGIDLIARRLATGVVRAARLPDRRRRRMDRPVLEMAEFPRTLWPEQTLQGMLRSAEALPY